MTYAELKTYLRGLINRSDLTDELSAQFIRQAQVRLERLLRTSFMQRYVSFNPPRADGVFRVPVDYLELIDLFHEKGELERVDMGRWLRQPTQGSAPTMFVQTQHDIRMRPYPATTDTMFLRYYGSEPNLSADTDTNQWTLAAVDALIYGAAELAGDYFEDERLQRYAARFDNAVNELRDQQLQEDFSGPMSIQPAYDYPQEY